MTSLARRALKGAAVAADALRRPPAGLVVLIYHRVGQRTPMSVDLPTALFAEQMAYLAGRADRVPVVPLGVGVDRVLRGSSAPMVAVTFDDGTADFADEVVPVLERHRIPVTLYVATDFLEAGRRFPHDGVPLSWAALRDARSTGLVDVGSHTHTHALLDRLPAEQVPGELDRSIELIGERVGVAPAHFAYPKAVAGSPAADAAVRERFATAALAGCRANVAGLTDPWRLARSAIQTSDGMRFFARKVRGGMGAEDTLRGLLNRRRYAGSTT